MYDKDKYRDVIAHQMKTAGSPRGYKGMLATAAQCQSSHISQVLHGSIHLTIEQAHGIARFWNFDEEATDFFISLVQRERSTNAEFSRYLTEKIQRLRAKKRKLSDSIDSKKVVLDANQSRYYASWLYPSIHMLATIPEFQSVKAISRKLSIDERTVEKTVADMEAMGLLKRDGSDLTAVLQNIHVDSDSPANISYHNIWRNIANQRMQLSPSGKNVHFTTLYSMSAADAQKLKAMVLEFIHSTREVVLPSPEETVMCFGCDLFEL
ncbi:MAG: hypothetical protein RIQ81_1379 [Pseudomonadota bacterium]|jgi:uncharacterized protein (TIGR02147 family)